MTWTIRSVLAWARGYLQAKGSDTPRLDAEVLLSHVLEKDRVYLYLNMDRPMAEEELASYRVLLKRRSEKEPIAYILGCKEFYSYDFAVNRSVLIPRPETEILVEKAVELAPREGDILEVGVGSGAVIISILLQRPDLTGYGNDTSTDALETARQNAVTHDVSGRLHLFAGDLFEGISRRFSTIVVNPPYVALSEKDTLKEEVSLYEPRSALFAGNDGLDIIRKIIADVPEALLPGGRLIMEVGYDQKDAVERLAETVGEMKLLLWVKDLAGIDRAVILERTHG